MCCFCVQSCRTRVGFQELKIFLRSESQRVYLPLGIHLQLHKRDRSYVDSEGRYHKEIARHIRVDVARTLSTRLTGYSSTPLYHAAGDDAFCPPDLHSSPPPYPDSLQSTSQYFSLPQEDFKPSGIVFSSPVRPTSDLVESGDFTMPVPTMPNLSLIQGDAPEPNELSALL